LIKNRVWPKYLRYWRQLLWTACSTRGAPIARWHYPIQSSPRDTPDSRTLMNSSRRDKFPTTQQVDIVAIGPPLWSFLTCHIS
jgi:hypothetical protein